MFTWISKAAALAALLAVGSGCGAIPGATAAPEALTVAGGAVTITGPRGYCIDTAASGDREFGAFVLLGSCASLDRDVSRPHPRAPGVLTVTVSNGAIGQTEVEPLLARLETFFQTPEGRASLSRDGRAGSVELLTTRIGNDALFLHARDASGRARGIHDEYWRALFGVNDRLVTLSVNALPETPLSAEDGFNTLNAFVAQIRAANASGS